MSPDVAPVDDCLAELFDPADRRYRYPFINCTNCGPRFTITLRLPYDRPNTTMRGFALCEACAAEYHDPADRRFHAQPMACAACGPRLWLRARGRGRSGRSARTRPSPPPRRPWRGARSWRSRVSAATTWPATPPPTPPCERLRARKRRVEKPFAVMVARPAPRPGRWPASTGREAALLTSAQRPIVLVRRRTARPSRPISALVAPGNPRLGVLLPYTPLHHLLFAPVPGSDTGPRCPTCWS